MKHELTSEPFATEAERDLAMLLTQAIAETATTDDQTGEVETVSEMDN